MKKVLSVLSVLFLFVLTVNAQSTKVAWITDTHIGVQGSDTILTDIITQINSRNDLQAIFITGDLTDIGSNKYLREFKSIVSKANIPCYVIPGNHDCKYTESGMELIPQLFGDNKFFVKINGNNFIGISSGYAWWGHDGHIPVEHLDYLKKIVEDSIKTGNTFLFVHHPPDKSIDNTYSLMEILKKSNIKMIFCGHGHINKEYNFSGIPGLMGSTILRNGKIHGYNIIETVNDSVIVSFIEEGKQEVKRYSAALFPCNIRCDLTEEKVPGGNADIEKKIDLKASVVGLPAISKEAFVTATELGKVYCFDFNGKKQWETDLKEKVFSTPCSDDSLAYVGTFSGSLFSFNLKTGEKKFLRNFKSGITSRLIIDTLPVNGRKTRSLIIGTVDGKLYRYDHLTNGVSFIATESKGIIMDKPLITANSVVYGAWDGFLYSIDRVTGILQWKWYNKPGFYFSAANCFPQSDGKNVYVTTPDKVVSAIDLATGKTVWSKDSTLCWESLALSKDGKQIAVKSLRENFYLLDASNGNILNKSELKFGEDPTPCLPLEVGNKYLVGGKNGIVYAVNKDGNFTKLLNTGKANNLGVLQLTEDKFVTTTNDGIIVIFSLN